MNMPGEPPSPSLSSARRLSPLRNSTAAADVPQLVAEQLAHFGIDGASDFGRTLAHIAERLYESTGDVDRLWQLTLENIGTLDRSDRIAYFNAKKFLSFQFAKVLDMLQAPRGAAIRASTTARRRNTQRARTRSSTTSRRFSPPTRSSPARRRTSMPAPSGSPTRSRARNCCWRFIRGS